MTRGSKLKLVAALLCVLIAFVLVLTSTSSPPLSAQFRYYTTSADGSTPMAVLKLTNPTGAAFKLPLASERPCAAPAASSVRCQFSDKTDAGWTNSMEHIMSTSGRTSFVLLMP